MVLGFKKNLLKPLPDGVEERRKKDAIFNFFSEYLTVKKQQKNSLKTVKYRFNQVKDFQNGITLQNPLKMTE